MSIFTRIKSIFSSSALAEVILKAAVDQATPLAATAIVSALATEGITLPTDTVTKIVGVVTGKIEEAL
jgi:hypothetical protein